MYPLGPQSSRQRDHALFERDDDYMNLIKPRTTCCQTNCSGSDTIAMLPTRDDDEREIDD